MLGRRIRFRTNEQPPCHSHEQYKAAETAFRMMDADGDGERTATEIYNALVKLGMPQSIDYVRDIVEKADEDGNGTVSRREYLDAVHVADLIPEGWNRKWETGQLRKYDVSSDQYLVFCSTRPPQHMRLCEIEGLADVDGHDYKCGFIKGKDMAEHLSEGCCSKPFAGRVPDDSDSDEPIGSPMSQSSRSFVSDDENEVPEGKAAPRVTSIDDAFGKAPDMEGKIINPMMWTLRQVWLMVRRQSGASMAATRRFRWTSWVSMPISIT